MLRSICKQSGESVESVVKKKKKAAVFVCSRAYLRNYTSDLRANFCARYRRRHCFQITGHMLLRRHAHANTPAASYFGCVVSWTTAGARLDEFIVQAVSWAEPAMHRCVVIIRLHCSTMH